MKYAILCQDTNDCKFVMQSLYEGGCKWKSSEDNVESHTQILMRHVYSDGTITFIPEVDEYAQIVFAIENGFTVISSNEFRRNPNIITAWSQPVSRKISIGKRTHYEKDFKYFLEGDAIPNRGARYRVPPLDIGGPL